MFIRKLECLGEERELPQRQKVHGEWHDKGAFFVVTCDLPTATIPPIVSELSRDVDVLKKNFIAVTAAPEDPPGKATENCLDLPVVLGGLQLQRVAVTHS